MPKRKRSGEGSGQLLFCYNILRLAGGFDFDRQFTGVDEEGNDFTAGGFSGGRIGFLPSGTAEDRTAQTEYEHDLQRSFRCRRKIGSNSIGHKKSSPQLTQCTVSHLRKPVKYPPEQTKWEWGEWLRVSVVLVYTVQTILAARNYNQKAKFADADVPALHRKDNVNTP
jgi:hypothetical protein